MQPKAKTLLHSSAEQSHVDELMREAALMAGDIEFC
jgi:hypothetical protein